MREKGPRDPEQELSLNTEKTVVGEDMAIPEVAVFEVPRSQLPQ